MRVSLDLTADALARLTAEAARRNVGLGAVIDELAAALPMPAEATTRHRAGLIGLGASSSTFDAADTHSMLAEGFGRD